MLDERLSLAAALYEPCALGADIGTDHGLLPCRLMRQNICRRMILSDVSPKALSRAEAEVRRQGLADRAALVCADGLDALTEPCGCVSLMGMGGETIGDILRRGRTRLAGAVLVLSAHTDLHLVRQAVMDIGYHLTSETLCRAAGRFYVVWRAEPGPSPADADPRFDHMLLSTPTPLTREYAAWRLRVLQRKAEGLRAALHPDAAAIAQVEEALAHYRAHLEE